MTLNKFILRDLLLLTLSAMLAVFVPDVASHGIEHMTAHEWWSVLDAGLVGLGEWALAYLTPITRRYGVGSQYPSE